MLNFITRVATPIVHQIRPITFCFWVIRQAVNYAEDHSPLNIPLDMNQRPYEFSLPAVIPRIGQLAMSRHKMSTVPKALPSGCMSEFDRICMCIPK